MSQHTPAPWSPVVAGSGDCPTWCVRIGNRLTPLPAGTASMEQMDADMLLIAAAPDLLAALRAIVKRVNDGGSYRMGADIDAIARAAIAKAEVQK